MPKTISAEERLEKMKIIDLAADKMSEERKSINNEISGKRSEAKAEIHESEHINEKKIKKIYSDIDNLESRRSQANAKIKNLKSDFKDCLYGVGDFDTTQLRFPIETEDPDEFFKVVKKTKVEKESKKQNVS